MSLPTFLVVSSFLLVSVLSSNSTIDQSLMELSEKMLNLYKNPLEGNTDDLIEAAKDYLCELVKLKMLVRVEKEGSLLMLREVYLEGNPPYHLRNVPWDKFIKFFNWTDVEMSQYQELLSDTRRIWAECLEELDKRKASDEII